MDTPNKINKRLSGVPGLSGSMKLTRATLKKQLWLWPVVAALLFAGVGCWVHRSVEGAMRETLAGALRTDLNAEGGALGVWTKDQQAIARSLARSPALQGPVRDLLTIAERPDATAGALLQSKSLAELRALLEPSLTNFGYADFFVVSPSMEVMAAKKD